MVKDTFVPPRGEERFFLLGRKRGHDRASGGQCSIDRDDPPRCKVRRKAEDEDDRRSVLFRRLLKGPRADEHSDVEKDRKNRERGRHIIRSRAGQNVTLSIPDHKEVARGTLRGLIRSAGLTVQSSPIEHALLLRCSRRRLTRCPVTSWPPTFILSLDPERARGFHREPSRGKAPRPPTSVACAARTSAACRSPETSANTPPRRRSPRRRH